MTQVASAAIESVGATKRFGGIQALIGVDLALHGGMVHGLVGSNGAGKSTLVGILTGRLRPDGGQILMRGQEVRFRHPIDAVRHGVVAVPQELAVPDDMTVAQFVTLGAEPSIAGVVNAGVERNATEAVLERLDLAVRPGELMGDLQPSTQKSVVVARALYREASVILLDEPTAGMNAEHAAQILELVRSLRRHEVAVLYISHRFDEVETLCDVVTVLRDGRVVASVAGDDIHRAALVGFLTGKAAPELKVDAEERRASGAHAAAKVTNRREHLVVEDISVGRAKNVSFEVAPGDIVGLAGLPGSGVEDVFTALAGTATLDAGRVVFDGRGVTSPRTAVKAGLGFLPASRTSIAFVDASVCDNLVVSSLSAVGRNGFVTARRELAFAAAISERLSVAPALRRAMGQLSGGNQQRTLFGRLLLAGCRALVFEDPTVGVDVVARGALHALLRELASEGRLCVVGSTEPEELAELADRVHVFRGGKLAATLEGSNLSEHDVVFEITRNAA